MKTEKLYLTEDDYQKICAMIEQNPNFAAVESLEEELLRADIVSDDIIPERVITLHSRAQIVDENTNIEGEITIVPPDQADLKSGYISVLTSVGAAVIGLSEGQMIEWTTGSGEKKRFRVKKVIFQPEAENRICVAS